MLIKKLFSNSAIKQNCRYFCVSSNKIEETIQIQQTTYNTDDWTDIKPRFKPFVGVHLCQRRKHPLRTTQEQIGKFFQNWFQDNISSDLELPIFKGTDPIESNTSQNKVPKAFYVNRDLTLRTDAVNREIKYLKSGLNNFLLIADLYRRCQMDAAHFPVLHRINVVRTMECDELSQGVKEHLEDEQKSALIAAMKHIFGEDTLKYRWIDADWPFTKPSWAMEIWLNNEWHRLGGTGLIRNEMFELAERTKITGWEIGIGLDRLTMLLYNIFDIRMLWNADINSLNQFSPWTAEVKDVKNKGSKVAAAKDTESNQKKAFVSKIKKVDMRISYILPENVELESFPMDELCNFIQDQIGGIAEKVEVLETFAHPKYETYIINVRVLYRKNATRTKSEIRCLHESARAQAAHRFNLTLRL